MGYIHDTGMTAWIPASVGAYYGGTWTFLAGAELVPSRHRAAAAGWFYIDMPALIPHQNSNSYKGCRIAAVTLYYLVSNANLTSLTAYIYAQSIPDDPTFSAWPAETELPFSYDSHHNTAGNRLTQTCHALTLSLATARWIQGDEFLHVKLVSEAPAGAVVDFYGMKLDYTLRL